MSWKPEVTTGDGKWDGNALRFATKDEAERYVRDLFMRWTLVRETRVVESDDAVNYEWRDGKAHALPTLSIPDNEQRTDA